MLIIVIILSVIAPLNCKAVTHNRGKEAERFPTSTYHPAGQLQPSEKDRSFDEDYEDHKDVKEDMSEELSLTNDQPLVPSKDIIFTEGYKDARWGMSKKQVIESFPDKKFNIRDGLIWFSDTMAGEDVNVIFVFIDDRLSTVNVQIKVRALGSQAYKFRFFRFERLLIQKYGAPVQKIREIKPAPYVSDADAILMGWGKYSSIWRTPESRITLLLQGFNYKLHLWIEYEFVKISKKT